MPGLDPKALKREIEMQSQALKRIAFWIGILILLDSVGVLIVFFGASANPRIWGLIIFGAVWMFICITLTVTFGYGYHNGRRNVEKMLLVLESQLRGKKDSE